MNKKNPPWWTPQVSIFDVGELLKAGKTNEEILQKFPSLTPADITDAINFTRGMAARKAEIIKFASITTFLWGLGVPTLIGALQGMGNPNVILWTSSKEIDWTGYLPQL